MPFKLGFLCILRDHRHPYGKFLIAFLNFYHLEMPDKTLSIILMTQIQMHTDMQW